MAKKIETAAIYGLGALGMLFGSRLQKAYGSSQVRFVMDSDRYKRHRKDQYRINGEPFAFSLQDIKTVESPSDLVIVAVKGPDLAALLSMMGPSVGKDTIILSLMNGITSEDKIAEVFGRERVLDCVAIGMDAMRDGTDLQFTKMGKIQIGSRSGAQREETETAFTFLKEAGIPCEVREDIRRAMLYKFMLNVGINQACTAHETDYGHATEPGPVCEEMKGAMREAAAIAAAEGICFTEKDIQDCIDIERTLKPDSYPSMRQDLVAHRPTEVELFAGTVIALGKERGIPTPVNEIYRKMIRQLEQRYLGQEEAP